MTSVWEQGLALPSFSPLDGDRQTDVLIIGGGLTGVLCAYMLRQAGVDCLLLEAKTVLSGVTKYTTAKITFQHGLMYDTLIRRFGLDRARQYLAANCEALERYAALCRTIDCDFVRQDSFVYSLRDRQKMEAEAAALQRLGAASVLTQETPLPFAVAGAVGVPKQAQFHPLKFAAAILPGLPLCEHTPVRELAGTTALTDHGRVRAKRIIVATHFPFLNKHGFYFVKMYQQRAYVAALQNVPPVAGMWVDEAPDGFSFRQYGDRLLLGGGGHRTGKPGGGQAALDAFADQYYPGARVTHRWATQDCMTLDGVPYIGRYSAGTEGLYVATGYNKWGMTSSMAAATILTDAVQGRASPYADVFSPQRSIWRPQLFVNMGESVRGLLTPAKKRCPHLGCALTWNAAEHTWDCPCHGSRFTKEGGLLDGPATGDLPK